MSAAHETSGLPSAVKAAISPAVTLLCVTAAAASTIAAAWLYTASCALLLLLLTALAAVLERLSLRWRMMALLLPAAALAGAWRELLTALAPGWLSQMGPAWLFYAVFLLCAPMAVSLAQRPEKAGLRAVTFAALAVLVSGALRELLAIGTLLGVRLLTKPVSANFANGFTGALLAGLVLALFRQRLARDEQDVFPYEPHSIGWAAGYTALLAAVTGAATVLLMQLLPQSGLRFLPLLAAEMAGLLAAIAGMTLRGTPLDAPLSDPVLPVVAALVPLATYQPDAPLRAVWLLPVAVGLLTGVGLALASGLLHRLRGAALPAPFRGAPATLVLAALVWMALSVITAG